MVEEAVEDLLKKYRDRKETMTSPLSWTTDKPTKPGWYYYQPPGRRAQIVEVVMEKHYGLHIVTTGMRVDDPDEIEWAGPIEEPAIAMTYRGFK